MFGLPNSTTRAPALSALAPSVAVIVPATDAPSTLPFCLEALARAGAGHQDVLVVREADGEGPACARNLGASAADADVLLFVDSDVQVHEDVLERVRAAFDADDRLTALFGAYDDAPAAPGLVSRFRNLLHHHVHSSAAGQAETFWAGLGAVRRAEFLALGGFDEDRFPRPSVEDIDLGMRMVDAGGRIELDPELRGRHLKRWTLRGMLVTDFRHRGVPWVGMMLRRRRPSGALNLGWSHRMSALGSLAILGGLLARRPSAVAGGLLLVVVLNRDFYRLLYRRLGTVGVLAGVGLHVLHHLTAVAAVPAGVAAHTIDRRNEPS